MPLKEILSNIQNYLGIADPNPPPIVDGEILFRQDGVKIYPATPMGGAVDFVEGTLVLIEYRDEIFGSKRKLSWTPTTNCHGTRICMATAGLQQQSGMNEKVSLDCFNSDTSSSGVYSPIKDVNIMDSLPLDSVNERCVEHPCDRITQSACSNSERKCSTPLPDDIADDNVEITPFEFNGLDNYNGVDYKSTSQTVDTLSTLRSSILEPAQEVDTLMEHTASTTQDSGHVPDSNFDLNQKNSDESESLASSGSFRVIYRSISGVYCNSIKEQTCGSFVVDLSLMRSLRIFFTDNEETVGNIIISSFDAMYKVLHFEKTEQCFDSFVDLLTDWRMRVEKKARHEGRLQNLVLRHFTVTSAAHLGEEHEHEGIFNLVEKETLDACTMDDGTLRDFDLIQKGVFFSGVSIDVRGMVWPYLLKYLAYNVSEQERREFIENKRVQYETITNKRLSMDEEEDKRFWRRVGHIIEKDVPRTDRNHPFYKGDDNRNLATLKEILLNYAFHDEITGYTQGMSDLLAPVLVSIRDPSDTFWCFLGMMHGTTFFSSPTDCVMERQLFLLQNLLEILTPEFYNHLRSIDVHRELLFCHRWMLLCFKREFSEIEALHMWEACWAQYQTTYFHLFICCSIVALYSGDVVDRKLPTDEILVHFSSLSFNMVGSLVLKKARCLLHQFRKLPTIPCTVKDVCPSLPATRTVVCLCTTPNGGRRKRCSSGRLVSGAR